MWIGPLVLMGQRCGVIGEGMHDNCDCVMGFAIALKPVGVTLYSWSCEPVNRLS